MDKKISITNTVSDKLTFRKETIEHKIDAYTLRKDNTRNLKFYTSTILAFLIALLSTPLESLINKEPSLGQIMLISLSLACLFLLTIEVKKYFKIKNPVDELKSALYEAYINKPDVNVLFIIKRHQSNKDQILVMVNKAWNCYFLPYIGIREKTDDIISFSRKRMENILGLKQDSTKTEMLLEHYEKTEKHHPQENVFKEYHSYYVHLTDSSNENSDFFINDSFTHGNFTFTWKSLEEIESDKKTLEKNSDVLKVLRENKNDFVVDSKCFYNV